MRYLLIILGLTIKLTAWGQVDSVDTWISNIHNNQLQGTCHFFWTLELKTDAKDAHKLIELGKPVADKLVDKLTDNDKGIICHFILSTILEDSLRIQPRFSVDEITYRVNNLEFKEKNGNVTASKADMEKMKIYWTNRQRTKK